MQESCKSGKNCLAHIKVSDNGTGLVKVEYYNSHNHEVLLGHLRIAHNTRGKIALGIPAEKIMDMIRDSIPDGITREHIITKQYIRNVQNQYNIQGMSRHANDLTSVMAWVEECKQSPHNPVLIFIPQGKQQEEDMDDMGDNDFLLVLQTQFQLDMLKANGHKCICMDANYGVNMYDFMLITVLVIDEYGEGIPVAWAISNREDTAMSVQYMKAIKTKINSLSPEWFMSDDTDQLHSGLCKGIMFLAYRSLMERSIKAVH